MSNSAEQVTLAVDPGTDRCGVALFMGQRLTRVHLARATGAVDPHDFIQRARAVARDVAAWVDQTLVGTGTDAVLNTLAGRKVDQLVIEFPQVYKHGPGAKVDPDSVLAVATAVGAIVTALPEVRAIKSPRPREWKQQVPKEVMNTRIVLALDDAERAVLRDAGMAGRIRIGTDNNVLDACGLGIYVVGRQGRRA